MSFKSSVQITFLFISSLVLASCSWFSSYENPSKIADITAQKESSTVYIAGKVLQTVPLLKRGAYQIQDSTGAIWILTNANLPEQGKDIVLKGKVQFERLDFTDGEQYLVEQERKAE